MENLNLPLVSIITPTYNHENYIGECIESVINQNYPNWEMIIVDDGSTDQTKIVCDKFCQIDSRVKYFRQDNKGIFKLSETYNFALSHSKGEYVAILEGDDYWYAEKLAKQIKSIVETNSIFSWCVANVVTNESKIIGKNPACYRYEKAEIYCNIPNGSFMQIVLYEFPIPATWLIKKETLDQIGGFRQIPEMPTVDLSTILELLNKGDFDFINEPLVGYRRQVNQATRTLAVEISSGTKLIITRYLIKLSAQEKEMLGVSESKILTVLDNGITKAYAKQGRSNLIRKEFVKARSNYWKALFNKSDLLFSWRLKSFVGILFSFVKIDFEWIVKLTKRTTYN